MERLKFAAGLIVLGYLTKAAVTQFIKRRRQATAVDYKEDIIYVHILPRCYTKGVINLSPFAIKLETWLRLHKIPYEVVETRRFSRATHQIPYVILNGVEYSDSDQIIVMLRDLYKIQPDDLSSEQRGVARAFGKMADEHMSWTYLLPRYCYQTEDFAKVFHISAPWPMDKFIVNGLKKKMMKRAEMHGIGRNSADVLARLGLADVRAISDYLGQKKFMFGDNITQVDCCLFGHLSQIIYVDFPYKHKELLSGECLNVSHYIDRVRDKLWPDWQNILNTVDYKF